MALFALDPLWNDIYTAGGFWVGVFGTAVGIAGFWIAITQIRETRKAAEAGKLAAERTLTESKQSYERFVGTFASRLLSELRTSEAAADWKLASTRCHDLAELLGTLVAIRHGVGELIRELRDCGKKFTKRASGEKAAVSRLKWDRLLNQLHELLDHLNTPFRDSQHGHIGLDAGGEVSRDRARPSEQNEGEAGELGEEPAR